MILFLFVGGGIGSFAMTQVLSGCSGYSMNSTISTSLAGIRMAALSFHMQYDMALAPLP